ncbi:MAG: helix-turn-helix domain-containing protein, partial [Planctomycetales bacterium]|nr:helix-turn-helix domain-containing protein [Planctomycetales bacterium]
TRTGDHGSGIHGSGDSFNDESDTNASATGAGLPELVKRLIAEKSTNVYSEALEYMERYVIMQVLKETGGNQSQAAEILGITRGKLRDRINTFNIVVKSDVEIG